MSTPLYLTPGQDWKYNLDLLSKGIFKTEEQHRLEEESRELNFEGKKWMVLSGMITSIAVGIILGITLHPAAFTLCAGFFVIYGIGAKLEKQSEACQAKIEQEKGSAATILRNICSYLSTFRSDAYQDLEHYIRKKGHRDKDQATSKAIEHLSKTLQGDHPLGETYRAIEPSLIALSSLRSQDIPDHIDRNRIQAIKTLRDPQTYFRLEKSTEYGYTEMFELSPKQERI